MARLQNTGRVSATNVEFDRSGSFADDRECLLRVVQGRSGENSNRDIRSLQLIDAVLQFPVGLRNVRPSRQPSHPQRAEGALPRSNLSVLRQ